jgi:hypothetical protein
MERNFEGLTADERRREIATILARGVLRLRAGSRPKTDPVAQKRAVTKESMSPRTSSSA